MKKNLFFILVIYLFTVGLYATEDIDYIDVIEGNRIDNAIVYENIQVSRYGMKLKENALEGSISQTIKSRIPFNAATIEWIADIPAKTSLKVEFSFLMKNGQWSLWQTLFQGIDVVLKDIALAYRYRVVFASSEAGISPNLEKLVISYNEIFSEMLYKEFKPWANAMRGVAKPPIVSRSDWGARPPKSGYTYHTPKKITIHHTWRPTSSDYAGNSTIRSIQNYHMDNN